MEKGRGNGAELRERQWGIFMAARIEWKARREREKATMCYRNLRMEPDIINPPDRAFSLSMIREE